MGRKKDKINFDNYDEADLIDEIFSSIDVERFIDLLDYLNGKSIEWNNWLEPNTGLSIVENLITRNHSYQKQKIIALINKGLNINCKISSGDFKDTDFVKWVILNSNQDTNCEIFKALLTKHESLKDSTVVNDQGIDEPLLFYVVKHCQTKGDWTIFKILMEAEANPNIMVNDHDLGTVSLLQWAEKNNPDLSAELKKIWRNSRCQT